MLLTFTTLSLKNTVMKYLGLVASCCSIFFFWGGGEITRLLPSSQSYPTYSAIVLQWKARHTQYVSKEGYWNMPFHRRFGWGIASCFFPYRKLLFFFADLQFLFLFWTVCHSLSSYGSFCASPFHHFLLFPNPRLWQRWSFGDIYEWLKCSQGYKDDSFFFLKKILHREIGRTEIWACFFYLKG